MCGPEDGGYVDEERVFGHVSPHADPIEYKSEALRRQSIALVDCLALVQIPKSKLESVQDRW